MNRSLLCAVLAIPLLAVPVMAHEVLHAGHEGHLHGTKCGHVAIAHAGHVDYLHDGHLHFTHDGHFDEHALDVSAANPEAEELVARVTTDTHPHGHPGEEHMTVQHGAHIDFIHDGRLHFVHGDHIDDHGGITLIAGG